MLGGGQMTTTMNLLSVQLSERKLEKATAPINVSEEKRSSMQCQRDCRPLSAPKPHSILGELYSVSCKDPSSIHKSHRKKKEESPMYK